MSMTATDKRAAEIVAMYEKDGKTVRKITIEGKRVEVEFAPIKLPPQSPDYVEW